jgi:UDP-N-acetylglucosamine diphosphorylase/glucosamine-1-phosphate N-acetyltransferase
MGLVVFEDAGLAGMGPLTLLRHASLLRRGTKTLLLGLADGFPEGGEALLWGRRELEDTVEETTGRKYNSKPDETSFFMNALARPDRSLRSLASRKGRFVALAGGRIVAARLGPGAARPGVITPKEAVRLGKGVERLDVPPESLFRGYWELVESNGLAIAEQAPHFDDSMPLPSSAEVRGPPSNVRIEGTAEVELHVAFDARSGPIVIEHGASVESFTRIMGPCYIGPRVKVHSALVGGGTSIFEGCKVGGEVENSVILPFTNKGHHGYVGDSYVGDWVNLGAGSTFSNLKNTYGNVRPEVEGRKVDSGMVKLGPVVGDMCKVSIGALVYAGRALGTGSHLSGLAKVDVPAYTYYDGGAGRMVELLLDSVVETQRRMMERRGQTLTRAREGLVRRSFLATSVERKKSGVKRGLLA